MPVKNAIGYSTATIDKQDGFRSILSQHMTIVKHIFAKYQRTSFIPKTYYFIDANAGDGVNTEVNEDGSPIIFLSIAKSIKLGFRAFFIEQEEGNLNALTQRVHNMGFDDSRVHCICGNNKVEVPKILETLNGTEFGIFYHDPNGAPDFELIEYIAQRHPKLDILIRGNTRIIKRVRSKIAKQSQNIDQLPCNLVESLKNIKKEYCLIRRPHPNDTHWDWTFLLLSNYNHKAWKSKGFYSTTDEAGKRILYDLTYTKDEVQKLIQPQLELVHTIKARSHGICEICKSKPATEIHHEKGTYGIMSAASRLHVCHECHCELEGVLI